MIITACIHIYALYVAAAAAAAADGRTVCVVVGCGSG